MIPLKEQAVLKQRFAQDLQNRVRVDFFGEKKPAMTMPGRIDRSAVCEDIAKLLHELAALSYRISLSIHDIDDDREEAEALGAVRAPVIVLRGAKNRPVRYFGHPRGRQFMTFVESLVMVAGGKGNLQPETAKTLRKVHQDVDLKVFVTPACQYSPVGVLNALRMALESSHVKLDVIDVSVFPEVIQRYMVRVTPITAFQDTYAIAGVLDEANLVQNLVQAAQGNEPHHGGDPKRMTPMVQAKPRQPQQAPGPRRTASGLILPR